MTTCNQEVIVWGAHLAPRACLEDDAILLRAADRARSQGLATSCARCSPDRQALLHIDGGSIVGALASPGIAVLTTIERVFVARQHRIHRHHRAALIGCRAGAHYQPSFVILVTRGAQAHRVTQYAALLGRLIVFLRCAAIDQCFFYLGQGPVVFSKRYLFAFIVRR